MKPHPILFSTPMVAAILEGRKTMTRRTNYLTLLNEYPDMYEFMEFQKAHQGYLKAAFLNTAADEPFGVKCPYGRVGDTLWVRESWKLVGWSWEDGEMTIEYADGSTECVPMYDPTGDSQWMIKKTDMLLKNGYYKLSDPNDDESHYERTEKPYPFSPSIHMPKEACRLYLEITNIRVERLQDITEADAIAEGIDLNETSGDWNNPPTAVFQKLWASINGEESWEENPWVWVIEIKEIDQPE